MPRSSRHKSSKHSSRDARDYSDSEKESSVRERKGKEESSARVSKESGSGDKRKHDSKDNKEYYDALNGEYFEERSSFKHRKEKFDDSVNDRWNGGEDDGGENSKKSKGSSEKSRRRDEGEGEEMKRGSSKTEGKHRESSRRESREFDGDRYRDREKKYKEAKSERFIDGEDRHGSKIVSDRTDMNAEDQLQSPESEAYLQKRPRRKKDDYADVDKHQAGSEDFSDRLLSSRDKNFKDGIQKEEKYKDERYGDKYPEDIDRDNKRRADKLRDNRSGREHASARSDEKLSRDEKDSSDSRRKKPKLQDNDHDYERGQEPGHERDSGRDRYRGRSREYERDWDYEREYEREREHGRDRDRDRHDYERDRYRERDLDRDLKRDRDWDLDRDRNRDRDKDRSRDYYYDRDRSKSDRERDYDRDGSYLSSRERKKSPDDHDMETKSIRAEPDGDRIRSQFCQASGLPGGQDEFRHMSEQRAKTISSREVADFSGGSDRVSKYRSSEKSAKVTDNHLGELSAERSSSAKASPMRLVERSPSSTSLERRQMSSNTRRRSLEIEETGHRTNTREFSASVDRHGRDLPQEKLLADGSFQNNSSFPPYPDSRSGVGSPLVGSLEEDNRVNISSHYKRGSDPNLGRGQGNPWRGTTNWPSPVPNGFIPSQHGPPHGGFHPMMPQFPSPFLFGVRPPMEMSHLRPPLGWQNMIDGSGPSHMHGWDVSNGAFRDESHLYGEPEWDQNRNRMHGQGWESGGTDTRKTQNGDVNMDVSSMSQKDDDDVPAAQATSHSENNRARSVEARSSIMSPAIELSKPSPKVEAEKASDHPTPPTANDGEYYRRYYLSKLDLSAELAGPELHRECVSLLIKEGSETVGEETALLVNLKDCGKAVPKSFTFFWTPSLFPATNDSVFRNAMELYKKQRVEMNGQPALEDERFGLVPPSKPNKDDHKDTEKGEDSVSVSDAKISDSTLQKKTDADEHVSALGQLEVPSPEPTPNLNGDQIKASTTENVVQEDTGRDWIPSDDNDGGLAETVVPLVAADGDEMSLINNGLETDDVHCDKETEACGRDEDDDDDDGPLVISDASPKVSGQDDTHESESVISPRRIHHSPESTH